MTLGTFNIDEIKEASRTLLWKWKTKLIHALDWFPDYVVMENKDDITAGDGKKHDKLTWKAAASTSITSSTFQYLENQWIATHFIEQLSDTEILAQKCDMIPLECIFRHVSTGSHYKREKFQKWDEALADGTMLEEPLMEFFYKNDVVLESGEIISDPMMQCDSNGIPQIEDGKFILLHPNTWEILHYIDVENPSTWEFLSNDELQQEQKQILTHAREIKKQTTNVWNKLKELYKKADLELFDGKIEFGINSKWELVVADVIDGDSCRLRKPLIVESEKWTYHTWKSINRDIVLDYLAEKYTWPVINFFNYVGLILSKDESDTDELISYIEWEFKRNPRAYYEVSPKFFEKTPLWDFSDFQEFTKAEINTFSKMKSITRWLLQDIARKTSQEFEDKYYKGEQLFERNDNDRIVFKRARDLLHTLNSAIETKVQILQSSNLKDVKRVVEWEWLDKQWYRDWENPEETVDKYNKLANILKELLSNAWIISQVDQGAKRTRDILNDK